MRAVAATAKRLEYAVSLDRDGTVRSGEGEDTIRSQESRSEEHLVLAGLCRCTVTSLRYRWIMEGEEIH